MWAGWVALGPGDPFAGDDYIELVNNQRTYDYARNAGITWLLECLDCPEAAKAIPGGPTFVSPAFDPAPWYDPDNPDTEGFYGVVGLEIVGADASTRQVTITNTLQVGGIAGPPYFGPRTIVFRGLLVAKDECSLQAGLDWLRMTTIVSEDPCHGDALTFFDCCPCLCDDDDAPVGPCWATTYGDLTNGPDCARLEEVGPAHWDSTVGSFIGPWSDDPSPALSDFDQLTYVFHVLGSGGPVTSQWSAATNQRSWQVNSQTSPSALQMLTSANGTSTALTQSAPGIPSGTTEQFVALSREVTGGQQRIATWSAGSSDAAWGKMGESALATAVAPLDMADTLPLRIGNTMATGTPDTVFNGRIYSVELRTGLDPSPTATTAAIVFPGEVGNSLSVPDAPALDVPGDLEVVFAVDAENFMSLGKWGDPGQRSWQIQVSATKLTLLYSLDGSASLSVSSVAFADTGAYHWYRVTRLSASGSVQFSRAPSIPGSSAEPDTWQVFDTVAGTAGALFNSTTPVEIGGHTMTIFGVGIYHSDKGTTYPQEWNLHVSLAGANPPMTRAFGQTGTFTWNWPTVPSMRQSITVPGTTNVWVSLKPTAAQLTAIAAGTYNTNISRILDQIPDTYITMLTLWHEPENDIGSITWRTWLEANIQFGNLVKAKGRSKLRFGPIFMSKHWITDVSPTAPGNLQVLADSAVSWGLMDDWRASVDFIGWDPYHEASAFGNITGAVANPGYYFDIPLAYTETNFPGVPMAIGETGFIYNTGTPSAKPTWLTLAAQWAIDHDLMACCYFDAMVSPPYWYLSFQGNSSIYDTVSSALWGTYYLADDEEPPGPGVPSDGRLHRLIVRNMLSTPTDRERIHLPNVQGVRLVAPISSGLDLIGDIEVTLRATMVVDEAVTHTFVSKSGGTNNRSWEVGYFSRRWYFKFAVASAPATLITIEPAVTQALNVGMWLRVTRNSTTGSVSMYTAADSATEPTTWTLLATTASTAGNLVNSTEPVQVGGRNDGVADFGYGRVRAVKIRNGIGGPVVFNLSDLDPLNAAVDTFISTSGHTMTVHRNGTATPLLGAVLDVDDGLISGTSVTSFPAVTGQTVTVVGDPLDAIPYEVLWRFDASEAHEAIGSGGDQYTDPRGRQWSVTADSIVAPGIPGEGDVWWPRTYEELTVGPDPADEDWCSWVRIYADLEDGPPGWACCVEECVVPYLRQFHNARITEGPIILRQPVMNTCGALAEFEVTVVAADPRKYTMPEIAMRTLAEPGEGHEEVEVLALDAPSDPFAIAGITTSRVTASRTIERPTMRTSWVRSTHQSIPLARGNLLPAAVPIITLAAIDGDVGEVRVGLWRDEHRVAGYWLPFVPGGSTVTIDGTARRVFATANGTQRTVSGFVRDYDGGRATWPELGHGGFEVTVDQEPERAGRLVVEVHAVDIALS